MGFVSKVLDKVACRGTGGELDVGEDGLVGLGINFGNEETVWVFGDGDSGDVNGIRVSDLESGFELGFTAVDDDKVGVGPLRMV